MKCDEEQSMKSIAELLQERRRPRTKRSLSIVQRGVIRAME